MFNLIDIEKLSNNEIIEIINTAKGFKDGILKSNVAEKSACLMFFENSTRTKCSFELACKKLGLNTVNFETQFSSFSKGESMKDTVENLAAIGFNVIVMRNKENGFIEKTIKEVKMPIHFINAGEGTKSHPTQALLDFFTIKEKFEPENKKIVIIGDIAHSRVAKSNIKLLQKFGVKVEICCPDYFLPEEDFKITHHKKLEDGLKNADAVMLLRIQKERIEKEIPLDDYIKNYQLNSKILGKYAPNAILMHPGPVNREIELTSELLDSEKGKIILEQAKNGLFVRMSILNLILKGKK